jgi:hypothetical protein
VYRDILVYSTTYRDISNTCVIDAAPQLTGSSPRPQSVGSAGRRSASAGTRPRDAWRSRDLGSPSRSRDLPIDGKRWLRRRWVCPLAASCTDARRSVGLARPRAGLAWPRSTRRACHGPDRRCRPGEVRAQLLSGIAAPLSGSQPFVAPALSSCGARRSNRASTPSGAFESSSTLAPVPQYLADSDAPGC